MSCRTAFDQLRRLCLQRDLHITGETVLACLREPLALCLPAAVNPVAVNFRDRNAPLVRLCLCSVTLTSEDEQLYPLKRFVVLRRATRTAFFRVFHATIITHLSFLGQGVRLPLAYPLIRCVYYMVSGWRHSPLKQAARTRCSNTGRA